MAATGTRPITYICPVEADDRPAASATANGSIAVCTDTSTSYINQDGAWVAMASIGGTLASTAVYHSTTQTITTTPAALAFDSESWDDLGWHSGGSNTRITVSSSGKYLVGAVWNDDNVSNTHRPIFHVRIDGGATDYWIMRYNPSQGAVRGSMSGQRLLSLTSGQYVELFATTAASLTTDGGEENLQFYVVKIA